MRRDAQLDPGRRGLPAHVARRALADLGQVERLAARQAALGAREQEQALEQALHALRAQRTASAIARSSASSASGLASATSPRRG
jgi:hypothetical protein